MSRGKSENKVDTMEHKSAEFLSHDYSEARLISYHAKVAMGRRRTLFFLPCEPDDVTFADARVFPATSAYPLPLPPRSTPMLPARTALGFPALGFPALTALGFPALGFPALTVLGFPALTALGFPDPTSLGFPSLAAPLGFPATTFVQQREIWAQASAPAPLISRLPTQQVGRLVAWRGAGSRTARRR